VENVQIKILKNAIECSRTVIKLKGRLWTLEAIERLEVQGLQSSKERSRMVTINKNSTFKQRILIKIVGELFSIHPTRNRTQSVRPYENKRSSKNILGAEISVFFLHKVTKNNISKSVF
jgi:hypothetical protein